MKLFRSVVYSDNEDILLEIIDILMKTDQKAVKYPIFLDLCASFLSYKKEWCIA